jgi:acetylornithine deacetylase/succinyl-diaminopimelate desuccinylase-like protein
MKEYKPHDSVIDLLGKMVSFDTVNSHVSGRPAPERPLAEFLETLANEWGLETRRLPIDQDNFNLLVSLPSGSDKPWLLFESHLDTVSVDGMTVAPFEAKIEGGRMYGRGALDTKSSGAAMLWTLRTLVGQPLPNRVGLLFTTDEEIGKAGARAFANDQVHGLGELPALCIVGEPTMLSPVSAHNGAARIVIRTHGVAAHSSNPALGKSAISAMAKLILNLEANYIANLSVSHELTGPARCSINIIHGGKQTNIIPDRCEIHMDRRIVPAENYLEVIPAIELALGEIRAMDPTIEAEIVKESVFLEPPMALGEKDQVWVTEFLSPVLERHNVDPHFRGVPYGTDASNFALAGIPSIVLGPGDIAQAHTKDEWISLAQVEKAVEVYTDIAASPLSPLIHKEEQKG